MRQHITGDIVANAVRMKRTLHGGSFLIVEGSTDSLLFRTFVDEEACRIEISWGKQSATDAAQVLNAAGFAGFLAIVDADFDRLQQRAAIPNVIYTDHHDLNCMVLNSAALERVLLEFGNSDRVEAFAKTHGPLVGFTLAKRASLLSHLLFVSLDHNLQLSFEGLNYSRFVHPQTLMIDLDSACEHLANKNHKHALNWPAIKSAVKTLQTSGFDPWEVTCGHHIIEVLSIGFRHAFAAHAAAMVSHEVLSRVLRVAYTAADFSKSALFVLIRKWEIANKPFEILLREIAV